MLGLGELRKWTDAWITPLLNDSRLDWCTYTSRCLWRVKLSPRWVQRLQCCDCHWMPHAIQPLCRCFTCQERWSLLLHVSHNTRFQTARTTDPVGVWLERLPQAKWRPLDSVRMIGLTVGLLAVMCRVNGIFARGVHVQVVRGPDHPTATTRVTCEIFINPMRIFWRIGRGFMLKLFLKCVLLLYVL